MPIFIIDLWEYIFQVIPDDEREVDKKGNLAVKLALLLGLAPKSDLGDAMSWLFKGWGTHKQLQS